MSSSLITNGVTGGSVLVMRRPVGHQLQQPGRIARPGSRRRVAVALFFEIVGRLLGQHVAEHLVPVHDALVRVPARVLAHAPSVGPRVGPLSYRAPSGHLTASSVTCQSRLTGDSDQPVASEETALNTEELLAKLGAVGHAQRLRIVAELYNSARDGSRAHVSELARRLGLSRPLLYMHLERLEAAGLVAGHLELSEDGKAMKYFELMPF